MVEAGKKVYWFIRDTLCGHSTGKKRKKDGEWPRCHKDGVAGGREKGLLVHKGHKDRVDNHKEKIRPHQEWRGREHHNVEMSTPEIRCVDSHTVDITVATRPQGINERELRVERERYYGIDWLRAVACIGIAMMHIKANSNYQIIGFMYDTFVSSLTHFVYLFMMVSSFVMCLGYFDKVMDGKVNWTDFYKKRYIKILPFFAFLVFVDVVMSFDLASLLEGLTELTLLHGFVPQELSVIGVGWYLGTVFVFYIMFPFFCVLIQTKKRAWISIAISMGLHLICCYYFQLDRHNILFSLMYFLAGGLIYQYRESIKKVKWYVWVPITMASIVVFYLTNMNYFAILLLSACLLMTAISISCKKNRYVGFISDISMEIYLSHMVMFRAVEKVHLNTMFGNGWGQYIITCLLVLIGATCFSFVCQKLINKVLVRTKLIEVR